MSGTQSRSVQAVTAITSAARARFGEFGYEATSIDDIAADADRTKGAVYHHFPDKRALFDHVLAVEQREIAGRVARSTTFAGGVATYLRTIATSPGAARITLIDGPSVLGWERWRSCDDGRFRSMLRHSLHGHGQLADGYDLELLTELLLGAVTEAAHHVAASVTPAKTARRYTAQLRTLIAGIVDGAPS